MLLPLPWPVWVPAAVSSGSRWCGGPARALSHGLCVEAEGVAQVLPAVLLLRDLGRALHQRRLLAPPPWVCSVSVGIAPLPSACVQALRSTLGPSAVRLVRNADQVRGGSSLTTSSL